MHVALRKSPALRVPHKLIDMTLPQVWGLVEASTAGQDLIFLFWHISVSLQVKSNQKADIQSSQPALRQTPISMTDG